MRRACQITLNDVDRLICAAAQGSTTDAESPGDDGGRPASLHQFDGPSAFQFFI
jgi:hypothetical protein